MTIHNLADIKADYARISEGWRRMSRHDSGIALARLEEIEGHLMELGGHADFIHNVHSLHGHIKHSLNVSDADSA